MIMEMPNTMKAIRYHVRGGPEVLRMEKVPAPKPLAGEVLVRVHVVGVNPGDWQIRSGLAGDVFKLPYIPGWDVAGVVVGIGEDVTDWRPGDDVFGMTSDSGGCAEYVAVPAGQLARKPESVDYVRAAALPQSGFAARHALFVQGKLGKGQTVLINGASGGVGHLAVQLAKWKGARVIGTASARNEPFVRELGADEFIDYAEDLPRKLKQSADLVLDTVGGEQGDWLLDVLKPGGRLVPVAWGRYSPDKAAVDVQEVRYAPIKTAGLAELARLADEGRLIPAIDSVYPLKDTAQAHEKSESRRARGKIVIRVT